MLMSSRVKMWTAIVLSMTVQTGSSSEDNPIDGTWQIETLHSNGRDTPRSQLEGSKLTFAAVGQFTFSVGPLTTMHGKFELATDLEPKAIDLLPTSGAFKGKKMLGIYRIDGKKLILCYAEPGEGRPDRFEAKEKSKSTLMTLSKEKAAG